MKLFNKKEFYLFMGFFMLLNSLLMLASGMYVLEATRINAAMIVGLYFTGMMVSATFFYYYKQMRKDEKRTF
jgi:hypothetical protein